MEAISTRNLMSGFQQGSNFVDQQYDRRRREAIQDERMQMAREDRQRNQAIQDERLGMAREAHGQQTKLNKMQFDNAKRKQLAQRALQEGQLVLGGAKDTFDLDLHQELVDNNMPWHSPYSYGENEIQNFLALEPLLTDVGTGNLRSVNSPDNLAAFNAAYGNEIKKGIGEAHPLGGKVVDKELLRFEAGPEGRFFATVKTTLDDGRSYEAPMTARHSADPDDPVEAYSLEQMIDDSLSKFQLAQFMSNPEVRGKFQKGFDILHSDEEPENRFKDAAGLRGEFINITKEFAKQNAAIGRVLASAKDPSPAGDLALIFNYMKLLDPGSVVREGEFATAQNSGGVDDSVRNFYNRILSGERLNEDQRSDFTNRAVILYDDAKSQHQKTIDSYTSLAERNKINPDDVIINRETATIGDEYRHKESKKDKPPAPQAALDLLYENPGLIGQFESKYGYRPKGF